jgi:phage terminase large subunit-like protein
VLATLEAEKNRRLTENKLQYYRPYAKQLQFHSAGAKHRERLLMAGNQIGKTLAGNFEAALHATGRYPDWWIGKRFDQPTIGWACGVTGEVVRDTVQRLLVGRAGNIGSGAIPKDAIAELVTARRPEGLTRTNVGANPVWMTFTPLLGMSEVVRRFLQQKSHDRHVTSMTIDDVEHYTEEEKQKIVASYPAHELEARTKGIPVLGSGRIFPVEESKIAIEHRDFPSHWPRIGGMDFGYEHNFAAVELVWDRDTDTAYVAKCYRLNHATPVEHAAALRSWGKDLRWAWPRDGKRETLEGAGIALAEQYKDQDLNMLHEHAQFEDGSVSVEAGLMAMLDRMRTGKLKVFKEHLDWWEEFCLYHRKDGKVVKEGDDLLCATRYALMMLRHASTQSFSDRWRREIEYPKVTYA